MSKSQSFYLKYRGYYLSIAVAILLLFIVFTAFRTPPQKKALLKIKVVPSSAVAPRVDLSLASPVFDAEVYYRPIIENNLFRPLGWRPPVPVEPYRLVGTTFPRDAHTPPQAIIEPVSGGTMHFVGVGDDIDGETLVVGIQPTSVTLKTEGHQQVLSLEADFFLNAKRGGVVRRETPTLVSRGRVFSGGIVRQNSSAVSSRRVPVPRKPHLSDPNIARPFSDWETVEGERLRVGDARLKNPQKWGLRRR